MALPIDWHGTFGIDTTFIDNFRYLAKTSAKTNTNAGNQEVDLAAGNNSNASFQSYIFRLQPEMIINDSATLKAEFTSGYAHGGLLGEDSKQNATDKFGNALYYQNTASGGNGLVVNKIYAELYSDTATYLLGRHSIHWGLGALINGGDNSWDRYAFSRDGITAKLKIGNFHMTPFWANVKQTSDLTSSSKINETGVSLLYDNKERDMSFGVFYGVKQSGSAEDTVKNGSNNSLGKVNITLIDLYFQKTFGDFNFAIEAPILSGNLGNAGVGDSDDDSYKAKAVIFESNYKLNDSMSVGLDFGQVDGDDGNDNTFTAMYLNPNYQIAKLMFRYNRAAISDTSKSVYDSYITNAMYFKLRYLLKTDRVDWNFAFIKAIAQEVSKGTGKAFNHDTNVAYNSSETQSDDMGMEFDISFDYHWNKEITIGGSFGYLMAGDYWAFSNSATTTEADNAYALQLNTSIEF